MTPTERASTSHSTAAPARRTRSQKATSVVRTIGPAVPLAVAMLGGSVINSVKTTAPGPTAPPPSGAIVQPGTFSPVCTLPFNGVRNPASDDHCGITGDGTDAADQQEATAKNNFCAPTAHSQDIAYQELLDLQTKAQSNDNPSGKPIGRTVDDRKDIENMGEGNYVSYVALIMDAHYSDTTGGEKVNCNMSGNPPNDIHIVLASKAGETDECTSTTAEMSPHYRPAGWTPDKLNSLKKPVRIRGQLFYDNSHAVCGKTKPNPKRASLWEIHPVYKIDVCKSADLDQCRQAIDDDTQWEAIQ